MHGAKQVRGFLHPVTSDLPKKTWIFFRFGFSLALYKKTDEQSWCEEKVSLHKVDDSSGFYFQKMLNDYEYIKVIKTFGELFLAEKNVNNN